MLCISISCMSVSNVGLNFVSRPLFRAINCRFLGCSWNNRKAPLCYCAYPMWLSYLTRCSLLPLSSNQHFSTMSLLPNIILTMASCINFGSLPSHGTIVFLFELNMACNFSTRMLGINLNWCYHVMVDLGNWCLKSCTAVVWRAILALTELL